MAIIPTMLILTPTTTLTHITTITVIMDIITLVCNTRVTEFSTVTHILAVHTELMGRKNKFFRCSRLKRNKILSFYVLTIMTTK